MDIKEVFQIIKMLERIATALEKLAECTDEKTTTKFWTESD